MEKKCVNEKKCGSCKYLHMTYKEQLKKKEEFVKNELEKCPELKGHFKPIIGMEPLFLTETGKEIRFPESIRKVHTA